MSVTCVLCAASNFRSEDEKIFRVKLSAEASTGMSQYGTLVDHDVCFTTHMTHWLVENI